MSRLDARRTLELQVKTQYTQAVLARDQLDFALDVQKSWGQASELVHTRVRLGAAHGADEAKIDTARLEADQAVTVARQALAAAKVGLAFLLGVRDARQDFQVDADLPKYAMPDHLAGATPESLVRVAVETRPDLRQIQALQARAAASIEQAKRARIPDIAVQAGFNYAAPGGGPFSSNTTPPTITLGLSGNLPIFYRQEGEIQKAEADLGGQTVAFAKARAQLLSDVSGAFTAFAGARELVERMEGSLLERARTARDLVGKQYQAGSVLLVEYLDASRQFIATNVEYLQDLASYWTAVYQLEAAVGTDLR
jgi:cobalt-zinc-cadmium efflux system outer membrane protein